MANIKFTNFARSKLTVGISTGATTITITGASGALFPALTAGQYFYATIENAALTREIVKVTARTGDTLTVTRAQDNTTALAWNAGDTFALRFNAAAIADVLDLAIIPDDVVTTAKIVDLAVTTAKLADDAVTTAKIAAGAVGILETTGLAASGTNTDITSLSGVTAMTRAAGVAITGTNTNDNAPAGVIGEFIESDIPNGSAVALVTSVSKTVTSIPLTAGDWDVSATIASTVMNTTTEFTGTVSLTTNTLSSTKQARIRVGTAGNLIGVFSGAIQTQRISLAAPASVYLVAQAVFASGSNSAYGTISARRVR